MFFFIIIIFCFRAIGVGKLCPWPKSFTYNVQFLLFGYQLFPYSTFWVIVGRLLGKTKRNCTISVHQGGVIQHFFRVSKTYTFLLIKYIFRNSIPKISAILAERAHNAPAAKFSLSKNHSNLKNYYFLKIWKHLPYQSKNN